MSLRRCSDGGTVVRYPVGGNIDKVGELRGGDRGHVEASVRVTDGGRGELELSFLSFGFRLSSQPLTTTKETFFRSRSPLISPSAISHLANTQPRNERARDLVSFALPHSPRPSTSLPSSRMVPLPPILKSRSPVVIALLTLSALFYLIHWTYFSLSAEDLLIVKIDAARPIRGRFPSWFGNSDVVGPSPWDYEPTWDGSGGRKRRVLFLTGQSTERKERRKVTS